MSQSFSSPDGAGDISIILQCLQHLIPNRMFQCSVHTTLIKEKPLKRLQGALYGQRFVKPDHQTHTVTQSWKHKTVQVVSVYCSQYTVSLHWNRGVQNEVGVEELMWPSKNSDPNPIENLLYELECQLQPRVPGLILSLG